MGEKRKDYTREFKVQAVELLHSSGKPGNQIEAELGIGNGVILPVEAPASGRRGTGVPR